MNNHRDVETEGVDDVEETADQSVATSKEIVATFNSALEEREKDAATSQTQSEDANVDAGPGEASSAMDFFLNCQQYHVNQSLSANRARAVDDRPQTREVRRTTERRRTLFFDSEAIKEALLAIMGE